MRHRAAKVTAPVARRADDYVDELQEYQGERQTPLWRKLLNIMPQDSAGMPVPERYDETVFPWLAPTRTSELASAVTTPGEQ